MLTTDPLNLIWVMPAEGILMRSLTHFYNTDFFNKFNKPCLTKQTVPSSTSLSSKLESKPLLYPLQQRQGQRYDAFIPKEASGTIKTLLQRSLEWAEVNETPISEHQVKALYQNLQKTLTHSQNQATQQIAIDLGIPPSHPQLETLRLMVERKIQGTPKLNNMVKWLLTFEYVPSTLFMLWTTNSIYTEMEKRKKITSNERDLLFRQEVARQGVGAGLHFARTLIGFEAVVWFMQGLKQHRHLRQWAKPLKGSTEPLKRTIGNTLHATADKMQMLWNKLSGDTNQTIASIASLMLMNTITYGITKPLMVNAAFYGMNEADKKTIKKEKPKIPALGNLADS